MNDSKTSQKDSVSRRRRVLRGVIGAPVVLTISSGASATMTSNRRCVANQVTNPPLGTRTHPAGTGVPATIIRVQIYRNSASTKYYISGTELNALAHPGRTVSWISNGQWQEFNPSTNLRVGSPVTLSTSPTLTSPIQYANVQVDQMGYVMSVGTNNGSTTTSMVAATCWNSFRAGPL